ncbi:nucleotide exchange factor GrpE [Nocardioides sp. CER19]|uniref:nucleotide exchange factor GrpE n=1 Tax=Nocardioides sp. CER19 TaxID=3038538 RepID=UPI002446FC2D|nr:nucleotide exchange factor GrpE [Nocardioides sp. CER19]MDH2413228.1 nucleotide exchange factor GrpE [Nocardioides sp. CER19]
MTEEREPQVQSADEGAQPSTEPDTGSVDGAEVEESLGEAAEAAGNVPSDDIEESPEGELQTKIDELTGDLQRLQAEFVNYKRRVDRDRELIKENATYAALAPIVEVLDNIDRAREHGPLDGGFKAVADQLERVVAGRGLTKYGEPGQVFDPTLHEALSHLGTDPEVTETTVKVIAKAGYRIGERVVRAAQVLVVDPE